MTLYYKVIFLYFKMNLTVDDITVVLNWELKEYERKRVRPRRPYVVVEEIILNEMKTIESLRILANRPLIIIEQAA